MDIWVGDKKISKVQKQNKPRTNESKEMTSTSSQIFSIVFKAHFRLAIGECQVVDQINFQRVQSDFVHSVDY